MSVAPVKVEIASNPQDARLAAVRRVLANGEALCAALEGVASRLADEITELRRDLASAAVDQAQDVRLAREAMTPGAIVTKTHMDALDRLRAAGRLDALRTNGAGVFPRERPVSVVGHVLQVQPTCSDDCPSCVADAGLRAASTEFELAQGRARRTQPHGAGS